MINWDFSTQFLFQINHINKLNTVLNDWVVIIIDKKIFHSMTFNKTAFLIKRYGKWTISCSNLKRLKAAFILPLDKLDQNPSITFTLTLRHYGNIFDFTIEQEDMDLIDTLNENFHSSHVPEDLRDIAF